MTSTPRCSSTRSCAAAFGVTLDGERDILGLWAGIGGEGATFWMAVLTDLRNRGVKDTFFVVSHGPKGSAARSAFDELTDKPPTRVGHSPAIKTPMRER